MIGAHGMLGRPVARRLVKERFAVKAMARDIEKARKLLPPEVEIVKGDLKDIDSIAKAAEGADAVYINLDSKRYKKGFRAEIDGTLNVIKALSDNKNIVLSKLSALGVQNTDGWWLDADQKYEAEEALKNSGHPYIIFRPTWFTESLPLFMQGNKFLLPGKPEHPLYWLSGDDYGRMVAEAFRKEKTDRTFNAQGLVPLSFEEAAKQFVEAYRSEMKIKFIPLFFLKVAGLFNEKGKSFYRLMQYCTDHKETMVSDESFDELYKPRMTIKEYVEYMLSTGDIPSK